MLDGSKIASKQSRELLAEYEETARSIGGGLNSVIGVVNRMDNVLKNSGQTGYSQVMEKANDIFKGIFHSIVPFSAKLAYQGVLASDEKLLTESGYKDLMAIIEGHFKKNALQIKLGKKTADANRIKQEAFKTVEFFNDCFSRENNEYHNRKHQIEDVFKSIISDGESKYRKFITGYKQNTYRLIRKWSAPLLAESFNTRDIILSDIFCVSKFEQDNSEYLQRSGAEFKAESSRLLNAVLFSEFTYDHHFSITTRKNSVQKMEKVTHLVDACSTVQASSGLWNMVEMLFGGKSREQKMIDELTKHFDTAISSIQQQGIEAVKLVAEEYKDEIVLKLEESFNELYGTSWQQKDEEKVVNLQINREFCMPSVKRLILEWKG